jgi:glycosyltransferase involved in cell wall biosynthesis
MTNRNLSLCFVAPTAWPVISGDRNVKTVGGAEVQQSFLARSFVKLGYTVTMICMDHGQEDDVVIDGVRILKAHTPEGGLPIVRFIHPRFTSIWTAMRRANADIYYQQCCGVATGYAALYCRIFGRKFVYAAAHDADFDPAIPLIKLQRGKIIYAWGLRNAHLVCVQNPAQIASYKKLIGKEGHLIKSCFDLPIGGHVNKQGYILWVSTLRKWKRPELFLELAKSLPQYQFRMIGGPANDFDFAAFKAEAMKVPNLEFMGFVAHADVEMYFDGARLFVNTSDYEGFPNTFLQSWARGMPTVSFFNTGSELDGDSIVTQAQSFKDMVRLVDELMKNDDSWERTGLLCKKYFATGHSGEAVASEYSKLFNNFYS